MPILQLPQRCLVNKKITKAFFKRNFDLKPVERKLLDDFSLVIGMDWLASINPAKANINRYEGESRVFEEVQIISLQTSVKGMEKHVVRLAELVQRYIPYQILLIIYAGNTFVLNAADKRINLSASTELVTEKLFFSRAITLPASNPVEHEFLKSLAYPNQEKLNLKVFYESYVRRIIGFQAAEVSGTFKIADASQARFTSQQIEKIAALEKEMLILQRRIEAESQLSKQIELNLRLQDLRKEIMEVKSLITK